MEPPKNGTTAMTDVNISPVETEHQSGCMPPPYKATTITQVQETIMTESPDFTAEHQMLESFFHRIATVLVSASAQSKQIKALQQDFDGLQARLTEFVKENESLRKDVSDAFDMIKAIEVERDVAKTELAKEKEAVAQREATITFQAETIARLEGSMVELRGDHEVVKAERDSHKYDVANLTRDLEYWRSRCHSSEKSHDELSSRFHQRGAQIHDLEAEIHALKTKIANVSKAIEEVQPNVVKFPDDNAVNF